MADKTATKKPNKKDLVLPAILILTALLIFLIIRPIAAPIVEKNRYENYMSELNISLNDANETGEHIMVAIDGSEYLLDEYSAGALYSRLMYIGMGQKIGPNAGEEAILLTFPDGTLLEFREGEVISGARKGRMGLYVYYTSSKGKHFNYCSDMSNLQAIRSIVEEGMAG